MMKPHKLVPVLAMLAGIVLPAVFTVVLLSRVVTTNALGSTALPRSTNPPPSPPPSRHHGPKPPSTHQQPPAGGGSPANFAGPVIQGFFGPVRATLTVANGKISNVQIVAPRDNPTSAYINSQVVPMLRRETLTAQSARINGISGATVTSEAYYQSLLGALKNAGR